MSSLSGLQGDLAAVGATVGITRLLMRSRNATIGIVTLDAAVREQHDAQATPTSHPVEADPGRPQEVSDHVRVGPLSLRIEGVISNHPAVHAGAIRTLLEGTSFDPAKKAHTIFLAYLQQALQVTAETTLKTYRNMVFRSVSVDRDASKGNSLHFTAVLGQITKVALLVQENQGQQVPGLSTARTGRVPTKAPSDPEKGASESALTKMTGWRPKF